MWRPPDNDQFVDEIYLAGERVPGGTYREVGGGREVRLKHKDFLPSSLNGGVACYLRVTDSLAQAERRQGSQRRRY
jgi:hypothetical protein